MDPVEIMDSLEPLESEIKRLLIEALALEDLSPGEIDSSQPLFSDGLGLDSIDALEIAMVLEQKYGVAIDDDEAANRERFACVRSLAQFVAAARQK